MHEVDRLVAEGPDPEGARPRLERFVEQGGAVPTDPDGQRLLAAIFASGSFLPDILLSDVQRWPALLADPWLRRPKPRQVIVDEVASAAADAGSFAELCRRLRRLRRREMLRLGARELGWGTTLEVARELSGLADGCLEAAVAHVDGELRAAHGAPTSPEGTPSFVVMGMGKLGGEELNFSSDIDLIYFYSTDDGSAGSLTLHEYYVRLSQGVTKAIGDITDDGLIFRVDLRLRPEGRSGAICNSLAAAESYYETFGRTWERQALLRARPCAGDQALGERTLRTLEPFIHPRTAGPKTIDEVRALRLLYRTPNEGAGGFNVKLGGGGIRDVELVAQLLQLLYAGKRRELRERGTLAALHKLALAGLLTGEEARNLSSAYRFWRWVEHRLQVEDGAQTHALPGDRAGCDLVARRLGMKSADELDAAMAAHRAAVTAVSDTLGEPEAAPSGAVLRLLDSASSRETVLSELEAAGFKDPEASAAALETAAGRLPPEWLEQAMASPDPDRALGQFRDLALRGSLGVFSLLKEEPLVLRMLAGLFGTSERLSRHLVSHPALWVPLFDGLAPPRPDPVLWRGSLAPRLAALDYEESLREIRRFKSEEVLRIGLHDVAGNLGPVEVSAQLGVLAEICLGASIELAAGQLAARAGRPDTALTVLALGSFGAGEMRYGSDLDSVFLYGRPGATDQGMDFQEWFGRLAQRTIGALESPMEEGRLYDVDTRLRPSGSQGMLVTTYASFDEYHHERAAPWERVALLRARPVYHRPATGVDPIVEFPPLLAEIAYRPVDAQAVREDLRRMRARIEHDRAGERDGSIHLRFSAGGLTDLEFLAAYEQLRGGPADRALRTASPFVALERLVARAEAAPVLLEDYRALQRASLRLRLLRDVQDDRLTAEDRSALARSLGLGEAEMETELAARRARVRAAFTERIGDPG